MKIEGDAVLKLIQNRIDTLTFFDYVTPGRKYKRMIRDFELLKDEVKDLIEAEEKRVENSANYNIEMDLFDEETTYTNCTVQVLHNTITDDYSVGWWNNEKGATT